MNACVKCKIPKQNIACPNPRNSRCGVSTVSPLPRPLLGPRGKLDVRVAPGLAVEAAAVADVKVAAVAGQLEHARVEEEDLIALGLAEVDVQLVVVVARALQLRLGPLVVEDQDVLARVLLHQLVDRRANPHVLLVLVRRQRLLQNQDESANCDIQEEDSARDGSLSKPRVDICPLVLEFTLDKSCVIDWHSPSPCRYSR